MTAVGGGQPSYATAEDLTGWLTGGLYDVPEDADRQLARASEVIDDWTMGTWEREFPSGMPVAVPVAQRLRDATCAQVEAWCEVGEENDIATYSPELVLAPRARRLLARPVVLAAGGPDGSTEVVLLNQSVGAADPIGVELV